MRTTSIDFMMNYVKLYLDGNLSRMEFELDFNYYIMQHYDKMAREHREFAEAFYYYVSDCGFDKGHGLSDIQFKKLIRKQYREVMDAVQTGLF